MMRTKIVKQLIMGALVAVSTMTAQAAPSVVAIGSQTSVRLSNELVTALTTLNVAPGAVFPGILRGGVAAFPIPRAEIDLSNAKGEVLHLGGLSLQTASTRVELTQFIVDTTPNSGAVLTGLVKANGSIVGRLPLFTVTLPSMTLPLPAQRRLVIPGASLALTPEAAQALNGAFGVTAFAGGIPVGTATVSLVAKRMNRMK